MTTLALECNAAVMALVKAQWGITPSPNSGSQENMVNGSFESGTSGWTFGSVNSSVSTAAYRTGTHSVYTYEDGVGFYQTFAGITVASIATFSFYLLGYGGGNNPVTCTVTYSDATTSTHAFSPNSSDTWLLCSMLPYLTAGKTITKITFTSTPAGPTYLDDVSILNTTVAGLLLQQDEYQGSNPLYQLVFITKPEKSVLLCPNVYKIDQEIAIELHVRPVRYDLTTIQAQRVIFENIKQEVQRIFNAYRYNSLFVQTNNDTSTTTYVSTIDMKSWANNRLPRGYGRQKENLEFVANMTIVVTSYEADGDTVPVGTRLVSISILSQSLKGLIDIDWDDTEPWVKIEIPAGPIIEQNLIGTHVEGTITCRDYRSINNCLMNTAISTNAGHYPINSDGSKSSFSISGNEFAVTLQDITPQVSTAATALLVYNFTNVKIKKLHLNKAGASGSKEPVWEILFMADKVSNATVN